MITVRANARNATYISDDLITSGSRGIPVTFVLSEDFDGLSCIAVFEGSGTARDVALIGNTCVVPHEVLATAGGYLRVGIYASNAEGTIVIPTVWAGSKMILQGTEPSEVDPSEPTPSWVAQVQEAAAEALANSEEAIEIAGGADAAAEEARQSASAAAASATAAGQSASVAGTAQAAAEAASGAAVSARDAAVVAQSGAESSASAAAGSATAAAGSAAAAAASEAAAREVKESIPQDYTDLSNDVSELKSQISDCANTVDTDASGVDLDITDTSGNVVARFKDGNFYTKNFDSEKAVSAANSIATLYYGNPSNNDVLFTSDDVSVGDTITLIFTSWEGTGGAYIDILNTSNSRITYLGRGSSGADTNYILEYTIPANFGKAVCKLGGTGTMTVYLIANADTLNAMNLYRIWQDKEAVPSLVSGLSTAQNDIVDLKYEVDNKLANPLYTTFEKYNTDHSGSPIVEEAALEPGTTGNAGYRIPTSIITNSGTVLVAAEHRTNPIGDYGDFSVDVARKASGGSWSISEVVPFDSTRSDYGSCLNVEFLADRTNDRTYLFYGTEKQAVIWWEVTTSDGDFRYIYTDDDGETWSDPVSLKSLWDTDAYDYCIPSCTQGITLTNGTFIVPCFCKKGSSTATGKSYPLLLIKPPSGSWYFSSVASVEGINHLDECAVVEGTTANEIWLYCRPNTNYGTGANRGYNKLSYNISSNKFTLLPPSYFETNRHCCFGIEKLTISSQAMYLMSFTDTHASARDNLTLWGSLDGNKWIRIYRINKQDTNGYSVLASYNGIIGVSYEDKDTSNNAIISWQDISALSTLIYDSVTKYIERRITVQDRMQMLYNALNGIE